MAKAPAPRKRPAAKKKAVPAKRASRGAWRTLAAAAWAGAVVASVLADRLPAWAGLGLLALSIVTLAVYGLDKSAAQHGQWRTPEQTLHVLSLIGGWPGALLAQAVFRHKTSKVSFQGGFAATVVVNGAVMAWLVMRGVGG